MIVALIITIITCVLVYYIVGFLASNVFRKIREEVFEYIRVYNRYLNQEGNTISSTELASTTEAQADNRIQGIIAKNDNLAIPFILSSQPMQKFDFSQDYLKIRHAFSYNLSSVVQTIYKKTVSEDINDKSQVYDAIIEKLSFENVYKISCLQPEYQISILEDILDGKEKDVLKEYIAQYREKFACVSFVTYIRMRKIECDKTIFVYTSGEQQAKSFENLELVKVYHDEMLCEGFQILQGNHLYDYGIRNSEIIR